MLKATELRIGNYVLSWEDGNQGNPAKVTAANLETLSKVGPHQEYMALKPIPLTPEFCETALAGYKDKESPNEYRFRNGIKFNPSNQKVSMLIGTEFDEKAGPKYNWLQMGAFCKTQYLHQLQNLYFMLSGEELSVNL